MKSAKKQASNGERLLWTFVLILWFVVGWMAMGTFSGCASTIVPRTVDGHEASYDGNDQTSGVISSVPSGFVVTAHFRQRYNALIAVYGGDFAPPLKPDQGIAPISDDRWLISKQAMVWMLTMNDWRRAGLQPKHP